MKSRTRSVFLSAAALFALNSLGAMAQNIVPNPDFDVDLSGWTIDPSAQGASLALDSAAGSPGPPSMLLQGGSTPISSAYSNCLPISAQTVDLQADIKNPPGLPEFYGAVVVLYAYSDVTCTTSLDATFTNTCFALPINGWLRCSRLNYPLLSGTQAVIVSPRVMHFGGDQANFDNIRLGPTGTVPVTLQSFNID